MLFPAAEEQARRKEEGQRGGGRKENQMVILLTVDGSRAERGYDPNGKELSGLRRKDVSGFPGEHEVVGLSTGWGLGVLAAAWKHMRGAREGTQGWEKNFGNEKLNEDEAIKNESSA